MTNFPHFLLSFRVKLLSDFIFYQYYWLTITNIFGSMKEKSSPLHDIMIETE